MRKMATNLMTDKKLEANIGNVTILLKFAPQNCEN